MKWLATFVIVFMVKILPSKNVHQADISKGTPDAGSRTLKRGLDVFGAILSGPPAGLRITDICMASALERATVYRLLATLLDTGWVTRQGRFHYVPGDRAYGLQATAGTHVPAQAEIALQMQPVLNCVTQACGDASFAIMREGLTTSSCVARHIGTHPVQILSVQVGTRQPLGVGAAGLALLSALPAAETSRVIRAQAESGELERYGGMTADRLRLLVRSTRERGFALVGNHAAKGALGVGIPVFDQQGQLTSAISVAAEMGRMNKAHQQLIIRTMRKALKDMGLLDTPAS